MNKQEFKYRYLGAQPFNTNQESIFFGRKEDIENLHAIISLENLVLLYSRSGLGKSSLINAGLIPKIRDEDEFTPYLIRFGAFSEERNGGPVKSTAQVLTMSETHKSYLDKLLPQDRSLWHIIKSRQAQERNVNKGFVLIFDQFEELFTYPDKEVWQFKKEIKEILNNQIPQRFRDELEKQFEDGNISLTNEELELFHKEIEIKVLFVIRSDRMSLLNELKDYLPNILRHCYELDALSVEQAEDAIIYPALKRGAHFLCPAFDYDDKSLDTILHFLTKNHTENIASFQLQILCQNIEKKVINHGIQKVTVADIGDIESIYKNHYDNLIKSIGTEEEQLAARTLIEEGLIFEEDERRVLLYEGQLSKDYNITPELLQKLINTHLIRSEPSTLGGYNFELSHDTLVKPILKAKAKRKEAENEEKRKATLLELQKKEETARQQVEKERQIREQAQEREAFALKQSRIAKVFSVLSLLLLIIAVLGFWKAESNANLAVQKALDADQNAKLAQENERKAKETSEDLNMMNSRLRKEQETSLRLKIFAEQKALIADESAAQAQKNELDAKIAFEDLKDAHLRLVETFIELSDQEVLKLNYKSALAILRNGKILVDEHLELSRRFMEMSFIYNESGNREMASGLLDTVLMLNTNKSISNLTTHLGKPSEGKSEINTILMELDSIWFQELNRRYYPEMIDVQGGTFCYRTLVSNNQDCDEGRIIKIGNLEVARTETTVWQFYLYALSNHLELGPAPSWGWMGNNPMVNVSWFESVAYCSWLNKQQGKGQVYSMSIPFNNPNLLENNRNMVWENIINWETHGYRLPSDMEWEYIAREGRSSSTLYSGDNEIDKVAWISNNSEGRSKRVGLLRPNRYGIVDLSGNVSEWCWNWMNSTFRNPAILSPNVGQYPIIRGGNWNFSAREATVLHRGRAIPQSKKEYIGFRTVSTVN